MKWMRPEDVRTPVTVTEGEAALDMIDTTTDRLEAVVARKELDEGPQPGLRGLLASWATKRAEVAYVLERIEAGEMPLSIEIAKLRAQVDELSSKNSDLQRQLRERATVGAGARGRASAGHVATLEKQIADLIVKNRGLAEALRTVNPPAQPDEIKQALKKSAHDSLAFGAEALDELVAQGVRLTPLAALFLDTCNSSVPRGYRLEWRAKDLAFKRAAAEARAERLAS